MPETEPFDFTASLADHVFMRPLPRPKISPRDTALLVIDMEHDFVAPGAVQETPGALRIVPAINALIAWSRTHGVPVVFTHEMHRRDHSDFGIELEYDPVHCLEDGPGCELVPQLDVRDGDLHVRNKRRYDSFHATDLDLLLRAHGVKNLVCCGVTTHVCVMSTVFSARHLDYRVLLPHDAVAGVSPAHHAAALLCMSDVFAYVTSTEEVVALWS